MNELVEIIAPALPYILFITIPVLVFKWSRLIRTGRFWSPEEPTFDAIVILSLFTPLPIMATLWWGYAGTSGWLDATLRLFISTLAAIVILLLLHALALTALLIKTHVSGVRK